MIVYAIYPTVAASESGVEALKLAGFREADISVMFSGNVGSSEVNEERVTGEPAAGDVASGKGVAPALAELGIPEQEAKRYGRRIEQDAILVSVHCRDSGSAREARAILAHSGAEDISSVRGSGVVGGVVHLARMKAPF
jgi:hypothetical protein